MGGKRKPGGKPTRKSAKPRNPLATIVRAKRAVVEPSKRTYTRKPKHRKPAADPGGDVDA